MKLGQAQHLSTAKRSVSEEEALKRGMEAKSKEFVEKGAEFYEKV